MSEVENNEKAQEEEKTSEGYVSTAYDWVKIEYEYITTPTASLRTLAEKYGCSIEAIGKRSSSGGWADKKSEHATKVRQLYEKKMEEKITREANKLLERNTQRASTFRELQNALMHQVIHNTHQDNTVHMPAKELKAIVDAMSRAVQSERLEEGQPTSIQKIDQTSKTTLDLDVDPETRERIEEHYNAVYANDSDEGTAGESEA